MFEKVTGKKTSLELATEIIYEKLTLPKIEIDIERRSSKNLLPKRPASYV